MTAPPTAEFTDDANGVDDTQTLTITLTGVNETGTAYWVVLAEGATPTGLDDTAQAAAVVTAGTTGELNYTTGANSERASGRMAITANAGTQTIAANIMIGDAVDVDVYVVLSDSAGNNRLLPKIDATTITDTADTTAPAVGSIEAVFEDDAGGVDNTQRLAITLTDVDEAGTAYWVVLAEGATPTGSDDTAQAAAVIAAGTTEELNYTAGANSDRASGSGAITANVATQIIAANIMIGDCGGCRCLCGFVGWH